MLWAGFEFVIGGVLALLFLALIFWLLWCLIGTFVRWALKPPQQAQPYTEWSRMKWITVSAIGGLVLFAAGAAYMWMIGLLR